VTAKKSTALPFQAAYPNVARWVLRFGWIEMGRDDFSWLLIRVLDIGGMI
jgi:hypothetical protein